MLDFHGDFLHRINDFRPPAVADRNIQLKIFMFTGHRFYIVYFSDHFGGEIFATPNHLDFHPFFRDGGIVLEISQFTQNQLHQIINFFRTATKILGRKCKQSDDFDF